MRQCDAHCLQRWLYQCYDNFIMDGCNLRRLIKCLWRAFFLFLLGKFTGIAAVSYAMEGAVNEQRLHNPFCGIATFVKSDLLSQGQARIEPDGRAVIYIGRKEAAGDKNYRDFLMAHECCHHTRGHLLRLKEKNREQIRLSLPSVNRSLELDADCCAGISLMRSGREDAVREAVRQMRSFGAMPTGSSAYPSGDLRATLIENCASGANLTFESR